MTDIGLGFQWIWTYKNLLDGFQDIGWIDMYQSTSDTKLRPRPFLHKSAFDRFCRYGFYGAGAVCFERLRAQGRVELRWEIKNPAVAAGSKAL